LRRVDGQGRGFRRVFIFLLAVERVFLTLIFGPPVGG
jgi:hypothetical protein